MSPPSPQCEDGYTRIANELLDAFCSCSAIPGKARVLLFLIRQSYGFNRSDTDFSASLTSISKGTGLNRTHVCKILGQLRADQIIRCTGKTIKFGELSCYKIEKDYSKWVVSNLLPGIKLETGLGSLKSDNKPVSNQIPKERQYRKTKDCRTRVRPSRASMKKKETDPNVSRFISWWATEFRNTTGTPYLFTASKEGSLVKRMLATFGYDRLEGMARTFLQSEDPFIEKAGRTIGVLSSQANKLAVDPASRPEPVVIPSAEFLKGAYAAS